MANQRKKALVVDFNNIWNKYLFVRKGNFSDTICAMLHLFRSIYNSKEFSRVYIVLDGKPCAKYDEYKEYKANRAKRPDRYIPVKILVSVLSQYFTVVGGKHVEGDEVTAYIAKRLAKNYDTYVYSNDKDFIQLMQYGVRILCQIKKGCIDTVLTEEEALAKFKNNKGEPLKKLEYVLPYRVFKGDSSDGIPSAVSGLYDVKIRDIVYNYWIYNYDFNEDILMTIIGRINAQDTKLAEKIILNKNNILRNYKLMDLCHISDDFKQNIKKIHYRLDIDGLSQYVSQECLYKWS